MGIIRNWVDQQLISMGYAKAGTNDELSSVMNPVFAGEMTQDRGNRNLLWGGSEPSSETLTRREKVALQSVWIFANIDLIAKMASTSGFNVLRATGKSEVLAPVARHELELLLKNPNELMGKSYLIRYTIQWLLLRGEAYWMLVPDKTGRIREIYPIPSDKIEPVQHPTKMISGYMYKPNDKSKEPVFIDRKYICYFRESNPHNYHRGLSRMPAYQMALLTDTASLKWNKETFSNEAVVRTVISVPQNTQRSIFSQIKQEILSELESGKRYLVTRGGDVTVKAIGLSQKDMDFLSGRAFSRAEIDRAFLIPEGFWSATATRANAEASQRTVVDIAVFPHLETMAESIQNQILYRWFGERDSEVHPVDIRPRNVLNEIKRRAQEYESMTINEVRDSLGKPPLPEPMGSILWTIRNKETLLQVLFPEIRQNYGLEPMNPKESKKPTGLENVANIEDVSDGRRDLTPKAYSDLDKWKQKASRAIRNGTGDFDFVSDEIPSDIARDIYSCLALCGDVSQVSAIFYNKGVFKPDVPLEFGNPEDSLDSLVAHYTLAKKEQPDEGLLREVASKTSDVNYLVGYLEHESRGR